MFEIKCLYKRILGIECPTCGITRAIKSILSGNINDAINNNPMILLLPILIILVLIKCNISNEKLETVLKFMIIGILIIWLFWYLFFSNRVCWR